MPKLYPPNIQGTLPSFYEEKGTVKLTVPFSMNKSVSASEVSAISLRLKTALTDEIIYDNEKTSMVLTESGATATFNLPKQDPPLIIGNYYKVQIAYINNKNEVGFYSTVGVIKFTSKPVVYIANFNS